MGVSQTIKDWKFTMSNDKRISIIGKMNNLSIEDFLNFRSACYDFEKSCHKAIDAFGTDATVIVREDV